MLPGSYNSPVPSIMFLLGRPQPIPISTPAVLASSRVSLGSRVPACRARPAQLPAPWAMLSGAPCSSPGQAVPPTLRAVFPRLGRPSARWFPAGVPGAACGACSPPSLHCGTVFAFVSLPEERVHGGARGARAGAAGRGAGLALGGWRARRALRGGQRTQVSERRRRNP